MQPQHYLLALAAMWLLTLAFLPLLFATARRHAHTAGLEEGLAKRHTMYELEINTLEGELAELAVEREAEQRKHLIATARLQATIVELDARATSDTSIVITHTDHQLLGNAADTLALAFKTWSLMPGTEPWRDRATAQTRGLSALAARTGAELRRATIAPSTNNTGAAA